MEDLKEAIAKSQALQPFKDQLLLDITPEGLRIQILDAQNRPMFDLGSARLKPYTNDILREVTSYLRTVPNRLSVTGHTDTTPYAGITGYTNWDLSTDRANAARRSMESAGLETERIARVVGLASSVLFDKANPRSAVNRRISIVVMTQQAEQDAQKTDLPAAPVSTANPPLWTWRRLRRRLRFRAGQPQFARSPARLRDTHRVEEVSAQNSQRDDLVVDLRGGAHAQPAQQRQRWAPALQRVLEQEYRNGRG